MICPTFYPADCCNIVLIKFLSSCIKQTKIFFDDYLLVTILIIRQWQPDILGIIRHRNWFLNFGFMINIKISSWGINNWDGFDDKWLDGFFEGVSFFNLHKHQNILLVQKHLYVQKNLCTYLLFSGRQRDKDKQQSQTNEYFEQS